MWTDVHATALVLAQGGGGFNTTGLMGWLRANAIPVVVLFIGMLFMLKSRGGDNAGAAKMTPPLVFGLLVIGLAITGAWDPLGRFLVGLVGG